MQVLLADDDEKLVSYIAKGLKEAGHLPTVVHDGRAAYDHLSVRSYDVAVLDIMMPVLDGLSVIRMLRGEHVTTPILILSAKRDVDDRVRGLREGGDDYLVKPFAFSELVARLDTLHRRVQGTVDPTVFTVGEVTVDVLKREVTRVGKRIDLQPKEYALLEYLVRNAGRVITKTMIMEHVWGYDFDPQTNVVEARISRLRDKIDKGFDSPTIHTVRGAGYVFRIDG